jgi:hypothetical protein
VLHSIATYVFFLLFLLSGFLSFHVMYNFNKPETSFGVVFGFWTAAFEFLFLYFAFGPWS